MVICLEQGADLHMAQLMPLPLTVSCFSKIQIGLGRLKMHDLKMQDWKMTDNFARNRRVWKMQEWKMTDNILANSGQNYGVRKMQDWKMTDHVN